MTKGLTPMSLNSRPKPADGNKFRLGRPSSAYKEVNAIHIWRVAAIFTLRLFRIFPCPLIYLLHPWHNQPLDWTFFSLLNSSKRKTVWWQRVFMSWPCMDNDHLRELGTDGRNDMSELRTVNWKRSQSWLMAWYPIFPTPRHVDGVRCEHLRWSRDGNKFRLRSTSSGDRRRCCWRVYGWEETFSCAWFVILASA